MPYAREFALLLCGRIHTRAPGLGHDEAIAQLAAVQFGVASRQQLLTLGLSARAIEHRIAVGRLRPLFRGVYAVGHEALSFRGHATAAVLACGRGAVASFWTASGLVRGVPHLGPIHVTTLHRRSKQPGIVLHRGLLPVDEITYEHGIPITTSPRTFLDLAGATDARHLRRLVKSEEANERVTFAELHSILDRYPRKQGRRPLASLVGGVHAGSGVTRSELEDRFAEFLASTDLPEPERNVFLVVAGMAVEIDCLWPGPKVAIELDGRDTHARELAFEDDRALAAAGFVPMRATWNDVTRENERLRADLRAALNARAA